MEPTERTQTRPDGSTFTPKFVDGMEYLQQWRRENINEYDHVFEYQRQLDEQAQSQSPSQRSANKSPKEASRLSKEQSATERTKNENELPPPTV
jgi:hypothetical protein